MTTIVQRLLIVLIWLFAPRLSFATVTSYNNKAAWQTAVSNNYSTVNFTGYPNGTFITNQYASLGVLFTDGNDSIHLSASYINDGSGLSGNDDIHVAFQTDQYWIGVDFPGLLQIKLSYQGSYFYTSPAYGVGGVGFFGGLVSTTPFDAALIIDPAGEAEIDDLHFGPPIPAPGALGLLAAAVLVPHRRTREKRVG